MFEEFLETERIAGKVYVLSTNEAHNIKHVFIAPVITRGMQVGIIIQDKMSGKQFFIELPPEDIDPDVFALQLKLALNDARKTRAKLNVFRKDKSNVT